MKKSSDNRCMVGITVRPEGRIVSGPVARVLFCKPMNALRASKLFEHSSAETAGTNCDVSVPIVCRGLRPRQGGMRNRRFIIDGKG
jgi:hypothetical protein